MNKINYANNFFNQGQNEEMKKLHISNLEYMIEISNKYNYNYKNLIFLDIGCGSGNMANLIINTFRPKKYFAIDFKNFILKKNKKIIFKDINLNSLDSINIFFSKNKNKFDVILLFDVIEHLQYFSHILSSINKLLSKNGIIIVALPIDVNISTRIKFFIKKNIFNPFRSVHGHINLFSYNEVENELNRLTDLQLLDVKKQGLGYGLYDKKFHLDLLTKISKSLVSRVYLLYKKNDIK